MSTATLSPAEAIARLRELSPCVIAAEHEDTVSVTFHNYNSPTLTEEERQWCVDILPDAHRTRFYDLTEEQVNTLNEWTAERQVFSLARFTYRYACDTVGLELCAPQIVPDVDPDTGEDKTDEDGKPVGTTIIPDHDFHLQVAAEGLTDCHGVIIPKGLQYFRVIYQAGNRPRTASNYMGIVIRLPKWCLNGEFMIKDTKGEGISEQHRKIARCIASLCETGPTNKRVAPVSPEHGALVNMVEGIHPLLAITVDTGKSNTGKDIFASDPELLPIDWLQTGPSLSGTSETTEYLPDRVAERTKSLGQCEGAAKMILARLGGKQANANIGTGNEATELAHRFVSTVMVDLDKLAAYCHVFACPRFPKTGTGGKIVKVQPVSVNHMIAAIALHALRNEEPIDVFGKGHAGHRPMDECEPIRIDVKEYLPLLQSLSNSDSTIKATELTDWLSHKASQYGNVSPAEKFSQVVRMVMAWFDPDEEVSRELLPKAKCKGKGGAFLTFGGADCGPLARKGKKAASEDEDDDA